MKTVTWRWRRIDAIAQDYQLDRLLDSVKAEDVAPGYIGKVEVRQDINRERFLWGYTLRRRGHIKQLIRDGGHTLTLEEAREAAMASLFRTTGQGEGTAGEVRDNPTVPETG